MTNTILYCAFIITSTMSMSTVTNTELSGLIVKVKLPAQVEKRDGKVMARVGTTMPIHCATPIEVEQLAPITHHYCGIFTERLLAPLGDAALVRIDSSRAEKVLINRVTRLLLVSSDGHLAQWRSTVTFSSRNQFVAGTPIHNDHSQLASLVIAKRDHLYAVSNFEGSGGYIDTDQPWQMLDIEEGKAIYGDKSFDSREELREYLETLPSAVVNASFPPRPILWRGDRPRVVLVAANGRQLAHYYLEGVYSDYIHYL